LLSLTGGTQYGVITLGILGAPNATVNSGLTYDGSSLAVTGKINASGTLTASLASGYAWVGGNGNVATLVATSSFGGGSGGGTGIFQATGSWYNTTNNVQFTGSVVVGSLTSSLAQGYVWVGGVGSKSVLLPTSSLVSTVKTYVGGVLSPNYISNVNTFAFTGSGVTINDLGSGLAQVVITGGSGASGTSGTSGSNGIAGTSGTSGISGTSGLTGAGVSGTSGTSGTSAAGTSGKDGTSGTSGSTGSSGYNGSSGTSGTSGTSGVDGTFNGTSGTSGSPGTSGSSGLSGAGSTSGTSGSAGSSGTSGALTLTGTTNNGVLTYDTVTSNGAVETDITFDASSKYLTISGSVDMYTATRIRPIRFTGATPPSYISPAVGMLIVSSSFGGSTGDLLFYDGGQWVKLN
jgi:hypothetical protein